MTETIGVVILTVVLGVMLAAYERQVREIRRLTREKTDGEKRAREEAVRLVKGARDKAAEIIGEAKIDADKWRQILDQEVEKYANQQLNEYKDKLQTISIDVERDVQAEAENLKKALEQETIEVERIAVQKVEEGTIKVNQELQKYRQEREAELKAKAGAALESVVKKVFGKAVKLQDHEQLIIQALEEAKTENAI